MIKNETKKVVLIIIAIIFTLATILYTVIKPIREQQKNNTETIRTDTKHLYTLEKEPLLSAKHCIVTEYESGRILYEKNAFRKSAMASTTKIMTALIVLENCKLTEITTVSSYAASIDGSEIELKSGENISVEHLLYGLMLESGNDAATALAEHTAGSVDDFCVLMNDKAEQIGANETNFTSPHGLDDDEHYTTAYDLALITKEALKNDTFRQIIGTKHFTAGKRHFTNTNAFLGNVEGVDGGKTGFTNNAGRCIVLTSEREGMRIITVLFGCPDNLNRTIDGKKVIDFIYKNYKVYNLFEKFTKLGTLDIKKSKTPPSDVIITENIRLPLTQNEYSNLTCKTEVVGKIFETNVNSPEESTFNAFTGKNSPKNSICGRLTINIEDEILYQTDIIHTSKIAEKTFADYLTEILKRYAFLLKFK